MALDEVLERGDFYLGSIAPDGIYTREDFTREQKRYITYEDEVEFITNAAEVIFGLIAGHVN